MPFDATSRFEQAIPFGLQEYIELVDTMARGAPGQAWCHSPPGTPPILTRLGMDTEAFIKAADHFFKDFASAVGTPAKLIELAARRQAKFLRGMGAAKRVFEVRAA